MPIDLTKVVAAILNASASVAKKKAQRDDRVIKVLKKLGLSPLPTQADFETIYAYALVEYGMDRPEKFLEFFRLEYIRSAFRKAFEQHDLSVIERETDSLIDWHYLGKELKQFDTDMKNEIPKLLQIFENLVDKSRTPSQVKTDQRIENLEASLREIIKKRNKDVDLDLFTKIEDLISSSHISPASVTPLLPSYYISRKNEHDKLSNAIEDVAKGIGKKVVAILGIGGSGKTVLAQSVVYEQRFKALYPDGALWAFMGTDASSISDIESHLIEWLIEYKQDPKQFRDIDSKITGIRKLIGNSRKVIIIDDVWHAPPVELLLNILGPQCFCIVTTRDNEVAARLGISNRIEVGPLLEFDAKSLVEKILGHSVDDVWVDQIKPSIDLLDWHILAVTLAAGQVSVGDVSWASLLSGLKRKGAQETLDYEDSTLRSESLRITFDLSLQFLSEEERMKFARLGVFAKGKSFSLMDVMMVWSGMVKSDDERTVTIAEWKPTDEEREAAEKLLSKFRKHGLLNLTSTQNQIPWYQLHTLLHEHATGILISRSELMYAFMHYAFVYTSIALSTHTVEMGSVYTYIEPQLLEILERTWIEIAKKETIKRFTNIQLAQVYFLYLTDTLCSYWGFIGNYEEAIKWLNRAISIAREQKDKRQLRLLLKTYSHICLDQRKSDLALQFSKEALDISEQLGNTEKIQDLIALGACYAIAGEGEKAIYWLDKADKIILKIGDAHHKGILLDHMGNAYLMLNQLDKAIACYEESVRLAQAINDPSYGAALCNRLGNLGNAYYQQARTNMEKAIEILGNSYSLAREIGNKSSEGKRLAVLGWAYLGIGKVNLSKVSFQEALGTLKLINPTLTQSVSEQLRILEGNTPDQIESITFEQMFDITIDAIHGSKLSEARLRPFLMSVISNKTTYPDFALVCERLLDILNGSKDFEKVTNGLDNSTSHNLLVVFMEKEASGSGRFFGTISNLLSDALKGNKAVMKQIETIFNASYKNKNQVIDSLLINIKLMIDGKINLDEFLQTIDSKLVKLLFKVRLSV